MAIEKLLTALFFARWIEWTKIGASWAPGEHIELLYHLGKRGEPIQENESPRIYPVLPSEIGLLQVHIVRRLSNWNFNLKFLNWNFHSSLTDPHTVRDPTGCECATTNLVALKHRAERINSVDSTLLIWEHFEQTSPNITFWEFSVFPDPEYCAMQHSPE